ncbi:hypothetical protein PR002_g13192 [Phytophthora rubi]|uniref:Uncharacterized protein n=1 Tax=Phytophthora rubi TaxID=129364 RepID=A0A6A3LGB2_9STRA|nr:hypothetical protein PR002_g13192 [Phytophthora rubi]
MRTSRHDCRLQFVSAIATVSLSVIRTASIPLCALALVNSGASLLSIAAAPTVGYVAPSEPLFASPHVVVLRRHMLQWGPSGRSHCYSVDAADFASAANVADGTTGDGDVRASWNEIEEFDQLEMYLDARSIWSLATDKDIKAKAWSAVALALNAKHQQTLDKANISNV